MRSAGRTPPVILLLPGTCCHWKSNFAHVIPLLERDFRVLCVSYDGFDETEKTEFPTMPRETERIETYISDYCGGHIRAAYGCSLGGSFVGLLAFRKNIRMDYGILGSSDLDQSSKLAARLQTDLLVPLLYPLIRGGKYLARYQRHFAHPVIHEQDLRHEELLACYPERWAQLVKAIVSGGETDTPEGGERR